MKLQGRPYSIVLKNVAFLQRFKTVGFETVMKHWQVVVRHQWKRADSMPVYEAQATLFALRHHLRSIFGTMMNYGTRLVVLTDSMTAAVSYNMIGVGLMVLG